uniref:SRCR domain-containing protein n=1 Tax=Globodera rostochiensis TaxID=31243 RepID=A0A914HL06_GLORO
MQNFVILFLLSFLAFFFGTVHSQQPPLADGLEPTRQRIRNTLGGFYSGNVTLFFRNSPYRVERELIVESGSTMTIETGVQMYFDTGIGMKVFGTLQAIGNEFAHIQMLPYQQQLVYDEKMPDFRLIDGPTVRQGRLQARFRNRWRSVCTQLTNWTSIDTGTACRSMGFSDGAFWRFFRRNNDTYPIAMPNPECSQDKNSLWNCPGFAHHEQIPLSENLCQGEDDIGIYCWGRPSFTGWARHWKGIQLFHSPFTFVPADPDGVAVQRESLSRLEFVDILYGGYDGATKNVTPSLYVEGVPPLMNGIRVQHSAYDGVYFWKPDGPILIANSTFSHNRGHGIVIESATDGRAFINQTRIEANYGDGIFYRQMHDELSATQNLLGLEIGVPLSIEEAKSAKNSAARHIGDRPRVDMCQPSAQLPHNIFFPHLVVAELRNGTLLSSDPLLMPFICSLNVALPSRLPYVYTIQFINVRNQHHLIGEFETRSFFVICNGNASVPTLCQTERYRVPILDGVLPQSVSLNSNGQPIFLGIEHRPKSDSSNTVSADVTVLFRLHASVDHKAFYGLNVTNSAVLNNTGNGIKASQIRDRFALHNVSVEGNQGLAGLLVRDGAADIWLNDTSFSWNWGDGINISYAGGSINLNTSKIVGNRWRGFSFHHNGTIPYWPLRHEVVIKGRPVNNLFFPRMLISGNAWGGVLVGNFCTPTPNSFKSNWPSALFGGVPDAKVLINWVEFSDNFYHPNVEVFACQHSAQPLMHVDLSGNTFMGGTGIGFRMEPCVNTELVVNSNKFHGIQNTALLIRNARWPQLSALPARVHIAKNDIKMNTAQFIVSIGLNEDSLHQSLVFNQQNEIRGNTVLNPFPFLKPRSTPYAALVVSSSNVLIKHNCFRNPNADFEIGTELMEHAKRIDARENNWGDPQANNFMNRIFDQFNRYSLATIEINPYAAVCNQRAPTLTFLQQFFRQFRAPNNPFLLGGTVFENNDLPRGKYIVQDDLHITPGAKLTLTPGTTLEFMSGIGMLVQGELLRNDLSGAGPLLPIVFTGQPLGRNLPKLEQLRLVDEFGDENVLAGRLEVRLEPDGQWGTVCNRSWTAQHAQLACNQLGLTMDPQHFENWRIFPPPGQLLIVMDNIRCEEREWDLTKCRHDGTAHNVRSSCRPTEVVGLRCAPPYWAGVRYSLLANPPTITGQPTMSNWVLEKAGLFDFRTSTFGPALQIDWNYHNFFGLTIRDNFHDGLDILYNDLTRKPTIGKSLITRNRRNGMVIRSMGLSAENLRIERNGEAGVRYLPHISTVLQRNIVSWLDRAEQPELEANGIYLIPQESNEHGQKRLKFFESQLDQRKFLVAHTSSECPLTPLKPCHYELDLEAVGHEYGLPPKLVVQIVNRANNESDEDAIFEDPQTNRRWSVRRQFIQFPLLATGPRLRIVYRRSYGPPSLVLLVLFLDAQEYLDQFVHVYDSVIYGNQYGVSAVHYSNHTTQDGSMLINRYSVEKLWFQRVNFSENSEAVIWVHSPDHVVLDGTQLAEIGWHVDNCSIVGNRGPIVDTHRDFFASANIFHWNFWSNTFANNSNAGVQVHLPDSWDLRGRLHHSFWMTENRFERNTNFIVQLSGYFAFANISSNNFTDNYASFDHGIVQLLGMEKQLVMERNRFFTNFGHWMVRMETTGQLLRAEEVPAQIQYNYFQFNRFLHPTDDYVEMWPRSYTLGIFGIQKVDIHFNRFKNVLLDFELVAALQPQLAASSKEILNATHNFWGVANEAELGQRVFDVDDWNSLCTAETSPYYTTEELFINFWWGPERGQLSWSADPRTIDAPVHDLRGRIWTDRRLALEPEKWYPFPYYYRPFRPYRITRDLTIMPGATLTIEKNVEVHVWPNVRILVYGSLIADATLWQPIRFKPINATEFAEQHGRRGTKYKRNTPLNAALRHSDKLPKMRKHQDRKRRFKPLDLEWRYVSMLLSQKTCHLRRRRRRIPAKPASTTSNRVDDDVFLQFPEIRRDNPQKQLLNVRLMEQGQLRKDRGFLFIYNATSGELVPSCDRHFTLRNAQVVCRELGEDPQNAYSWLTPQWDYNPQLRILKTYMEPRECRGIERHLEHCALRLTATLSDWQCIDSEHFNYVHCGPESALSADYVGHWGGITFARHSLEHGGGGGDDGYADERSILRHVEVVGGGRVHNDTLHGAALQVVRRAPLLQNVNVTNSSMHALQLLHPSNNIVLSRLNISDNRGIGVNILATTLHSTSDTMSGAATGGSASSRVPRGPITIPYRIPGMLDICSMGKEVKVAGRVLLYYKYDSYPVDCVKVFSSRLATGDVQRPLGFRLLQANFYQAPAGVPRPDALYVYVGTTFSSSAQLRVFNASSDLSNGVASVATQSPSLGIHLRATAADGDYGFLAEVATLPTAPISSKPVDEVSLRVSRLLNNDRGALHYRNVGEMGPNVIIEQCVMDNNGYHLYGNISTSLQAMELHVHNTMLLLFRANSLRYNRGGVLLTANSSSPLARLSAVLKSNTLAFNTNSTSLALFGNGLQQATFLNNLIAHNYALYADTILINGISSNFSHNLIVSNVGWHTIDTENLNGVNSWHVPLHLLDNVFEDNWSLGHGHQYMERYGYHDGNERDEFLSKRPKRQILSQHGVSFDWWTHVGPRELSRYRSTVLIGSAHQQQIYKNLFNNPKNDFELTTTEMAGGPARFDTAVAVVDARNNYWGPPGTVGVASAKIRDQKDDPRLIRVNFMPLLASNISLREGDCSPGWFQVGHEEFKSCFLFVGASSTYLDAVQFCQALDAFMPILRNEDERREELARRIDALGQQYVTQVERHNSFGIAYDIPVWISSVTIPSNQCGWMSSRTASVGEQNCNNLLPFVCEKGTLPYREPLLWRRDFLIACICLIALLTIIAAIACCACQRAQRKAQQFPHQKTFLRESLRDKRQNHNFAPFSPVSATGLLSQETFGPSAASTLPKTVSSPTTEYESCCNSSFSTNAHRFPFASSCPTCSCTVCCCCYSATNSSSSSHFSAGEYSLPEAELNTSSSSNSTKKLYSLCSGFSASSVSSDSVADQSINSDSTLTAQNVKRRNGQNCTNRNSNALVAATNHNKWINESEETLCHYPEYAPPDPAPSTGYVNLGRDRTTMANIGHLRRPLPRPMANFVKRASMEDIKILETSM